MIIYIAFKEGDMLDNVSISNCKKVEYKDGLLFVTISKDSKYEHTTTENTVVDGTYFINWHKNSYSSDQTLCFILRDIGTFIIKGEVV